MEKKQRGHVEVSIEEQMLILRAMPKNKCNWQAVYADVLKDLQKLPDRAKALYSEAKFDKIRRRMSDQISKLVTKDPALIQSIEIKQLISQVAVSAEPMKEPDEQIMPPPVQPAKPMEERDEQIIPPPVRAKKRTAEDPAAEANQAQPNKRYNAIPIDDIDEQPDEPEDIEDPVPVPPKKKKTTNELARETYEVYLERASSGKDLERKMDKCMDKFLSM
ncbi:Hypothetical predicted protein [Mytilus galloprovincialis]|uniref:Uncharacterized protein n=1 Tax=Mytilus galloprovincialis TaxID=29158 RepID=A0A8B6F5W4_MYTGA|nr:Hypothetical predicted protein [Mytilus galloprovincialis]